MRFTLRRYMCIVGKGKKKAKKRGRQLSPSSPGRGAILEIGVGGYADPQNLLGCVEVHLDPKQGCGREDYAFNLADNRQRIVKLMVKHGMMCGISGANFTWRPMSLSIQCSWRSVAKQRVFSWQCLGVAVSRNNWDRALAHEGT